MKTPIKLAEERLQIAYDFAELGKRLAYLKSLKAMWWQSERKGFKSDTSCERAWDLLKDGQEMEQVQLKMRAKQMKSSALRTLLEVVESEKRNQY